MTTVLVVAVLALLALAAWRLDVRARLRRGDAGTDERARARQEIGRQIDNGRAGGQGWL
ncbi:hypothetical protein [Kineococcus sp. SYSU DK004]|uniref:hypothetical protein n=1 Tax=Kineococcus sp. SYSU DK004 TaxID=3383125 RepID=UPI003D7C8D93